MSTLHIFASIVGYAGALLLFIQVVFGSRHIFSFFTKDTVLINKIHKLIGIYGTLLVFSHPLLEMMWRQNSFLWLITPNFSFETETNISFGRFALYLLAIIWVTSAIVREKIKWRPWKYLHLLAYPLVFLMFIHAMDIGSFYEEYLFMRVMWFSFFALFIISALYRFLVWGGFSKKKTKIIKKAMQGDTILLLTLEFPVGIADPNIGQHMYLQAKGFGSEHPFTVMEFDKAKNEITFGMRTGGKFVENLKYFQPGSELLLDGPYGVFTKEAWNLDEEIIIAGGIGVTPFIRLAREYGKSKTFLYANRKVEDAVLRSVLRQEVAMYKDIVESYEGVPDENVLVGRLDAERLVSLLGEKIKTVPFFLCGSPMFISVMKTTLLSLSIHQRKIFIMKSLAFNV